MSDFSDPDFEDGWTSAADRRANRAEQLAADLRTQAITEQKRAEKAEAERDALIDERAKLDRKLATMTDVARSNREHVRAIVPELDKAEAAIARVRALHTRWDCDANNCAHCVDSYGTPTPYPCPTLRALDEQTDQPPPIHIGNHANAEDCPGCSGTNPPYPFTCPAQPGDPGGPYPTT